MSKHISKTLMKSRLLAQPLSTSSQKVSAFLSAGGRPKTPLNSSNHHTGWERTRRAVCEQHLSESNRRSDV